MSELMQLLFQYALENGFTAQLTNQRYTALKTLIARLERQLQVLLSDDQQDALSKY